MQCLLSRPRLFSPPSAPAENARLLVGCDTFRTAFFKIVSALVPFSRRRIFEGVIDGRNLRLRGYPCGNDFGAGVATARTAFPNSFRARASSCRSSRSNRDTELHMPYPLPGSERRRSAWAASRPLLDQAAAARRVQKQAGLLVMCVPEHQQGDHKTDRRLMMDLAQRGLQLLISELGLELFRQPALEMLFHLYAKPDSQPPSLTGLTSVSSTSERNSQRIVHRMVERMLVTTGPDFEDGRRTIVELTDVGRLAIDRFLDSWASSPEFKALVEKATRL